MSDFNQITFENLMVSQNKELKDKVVNTWKKLSALPENADPEKRVKQVVFVALKNGEVVGITTAFLAPYEKLRNNLLFVFRGLIVPEFRIPGLFQKLSQLTYEFLQEKSQEMDPKPLGLIAEIENKNLKSLNLVTTQTGFHLIGFSSRGNPVHVKYFKRAKYH